MAGGATSGGNKSQVTACCRSQCWTQLALARHVATGDRGNGDWTSCAPHAWGQIAVLGNAHAALSHDCSTVGGVISIARASIRAPWSAIATTVQHYSAIASVCHSAPFTLSRTQEARKRKRERNHAEGQKMIKSYHQADCGTLNANSTTVHSCLLHTYIYIYIYIGDRQPGRGSVAHRHAFHCSYVLRPRAQWPSERANGFPRSFDCRWSTATATF